jgi:hypothetical protein
MNVISLSLFGYNQNHQYCHPHQTFVRFLPLIIRAYDSLYPDWKIHLFINKESYDFMPAFYDGISNNNIIDKLSFKQSTSLCKDMLWRIEPVSYANRTLCRDIDSLPTYRDRQMTEIWMNDDTIAHSINDSSSHTIALMGGMVSFKKNAFDTKMVDSYSIDWNIKGADQNFLNDKVYPIVCNSITEHRIQGMPVRNENECSYNQVSDVNVDCKLSTELKARCNQLVNHAGQGGFHLGQVHNTILNRTYEGAVPFWLQYCDQSLNNKLMAIESQYPDIFYWMV